MIRTFLVALLAAASLGGAAHGQAQQRPMPSYQDDESYGQPTPSDDNANSRDARQDEGYPRNYGNPPIRQPGSGRQDTPSDDGYGGYDALQPPADRHEDASHQADRRRTTELNQRAYAHPNAGGSQSDYAQQSAQYRAELDDHAHAMQDYQAARARYAERIARWRARADACEAGHLDACEGPE